MRLLMVSALFLFCFSSAIQAQNEPNTMTTTISVNALVTQSIEVQTVRNVRLTNFQPDINEYVVSPINDANAGFMIARGTAEASIRINYLDELLLTQPNGPGRIRIFYRVSGYDRDEQVNSEILQSNDRSLNFSDEGEFYLWIGGRIIIENAAPGNYEGEFTIEIDYI